MTDSSSTDVHDIVDDSTNNWFRQSPIQRQRWGDKQVLPHVNWGDLFFDLFYVAAAYNLAYIIKSDPSFISLMYFAGCFGPITSIWHAKVLYDARFQEPENDIFHVVLEIVQICIVALAVLHIRPVKYMSNGSGPETFCFCLAILINTFITIMKEMEIIYWGVKGQTSARYSSMTYILSYLPSFIILTLATMYSGIAYFNNIDDAYTKKDWLLAETSTDDYSINTTKADHVPIILMICAYIIRLIVFYPISYYRGKGSNFKLYQIPMNVDFVIHRYGEWTMLMLGESILSLLIVDIADESFNFYVTFFIGIVSVIFLQYLYFKSQPLHADDHALRRTRGSGILWSTVMQLYSAALIIVGVSYKMVLSEFTYEISTENTYGSSKTVLGRFLAGGISSSGDYSKNERRQRVAYFFCLGMAFVFLCLDTMSTSHKGLRATVERCHCPDSGHFRLRGIILVVFLRWLGIAFIATACFYVTEPMHVTIVGFAAILLQIIIRYLGSFYFPQPKVHVFPSDHEEQHA